jgi:hypothetical protein
MDRKTIKGVYVYGHYLPGGICQYVGQGRKNRAWSFSQRSKIWQIFFSKRKPLVKIFAHSLTEDEAIELECKLIAEHKLRNEALANCSGGGERGWPSLLGRSLSPEHREAISRGKRGRDNGLAGRIMPSEHRKAISQATQGRRALTADEQAKRLATWRANGMTTKKARTVECVETGIIYRCAKEAAQQVSGSDKHIQACCTGKRSRHMKLSWRYV